VRTGRGRSIEVRGDGDEIKRQMEGGMNKMERK
jgi:hypothetical protein